MVCVRYIKVVYKKNQFFKKNNQYGCKFVIKKRKINLKNACKKFVGIYKSAQTLHLPKVNSL